MRDVQSKWVIKQGTSQKDKNCERKELKKESMWGREKQFSIRRQTERKKKQWYIGRQTTSNKKEIERKRETMKDW